MFTHVQKVLSLNFLSQNVPKEIFMQRFTRQSFIQKHWGVPELFKKTSREEGAGEEEYTPEKKFAKG